MRDDFMFLLVATMLFTSALAVLNTIDALNGHYCPHCAHCFARNEEKRRQQELRVESRRRLKPPGAGSGEGQDD